MDPIVSLDDVEKRKFLLLPGLEPRILGRPARSQSLYRLRYASSNIGHQSFLAYFSWIEKIKVGL
jgi:hypothetical protein